MTATERESTSPPPPTPPLPHSKPGGTRVTRSSLACLSCRSRHLKCDGRKPHCSRCAESDRRCDYTPSRRGGLDRAALGERRRRLEAAVSNSNSSNNTHANDSARSTCFFLPSFDSLSRSERDVAASDDALLAQALSCTESPSTPGVEYHDLATDGLFNAYYDNFHKFHPFVLPRTKFLQLHDLPSGKSSLKPLVAVMRFVGSIYRDRTWSAPLHALVADSLLSPSDPPPSLDPIIVQSRLLYSVVLFWQSYEDDAARQMRAATQAAHDLGMFRREFADGAARGDAVVAECWRRTWWMLYIIDAYYAGTLGTLNFTVQNVEATVDLPCEEHEYESGNIPEPKTLQDFDSREFASEDVSFSSFAYLIGAVQCAALAISTTPKATAKDASEQVVQAADAIIDAWLLLLPKGSKEVMTKSGEIDELMFQAHLVIHVSTVGLHRPLSDLKFNAVESISSCAREPPLETPHPPLINVHTIRVLRATESQIRLLTLPSRPFHHTPFVTCMVSEGTLARLSACKFHFQGRALAIARDQIRMIIGCLKELGEIWARAAKNVKEIQTIARHAFGMGTPTTKSTTPQPTTPQLTPSSSLPSSKGPEEVDIQVETIGEDFFSGIQDLSNMCGWFDLPEQVSEMAWMSNNEEMQHSS
jgi:hypothetical protein